MRACFGSMVDEFHPLRRCPSARKISSTAQQTCPRVDSQRVMGWGLGRRGGGARGARRRGEWHARKEHWSPRGAKVHINVESSRTPAVSNYLARRAATKMWASRPRQTALKIQCRWSGHGAGSAVSNGDARVERGVAPWANISNGVHPVDCIYTRVKVTLRIPTRALHSTRNS